MEWPVYKRGGPLKTPNTGTHGNSAGAEELQQSAERKQGAAAIPALTAAATAYKEALRLARAQPLPAERQHDAYFGLVSPLGGLDS